MDKKDIAKHINTEIRIDIRQILDQNHTLSIACLTLYTAIITIVATFLGKNNNQLAVSFVFIPFPFLALWLIFLGKLFGIINMTNYLIKEIEPILQENSNFNITQWETYLKTELNYTNRLLHQGFWPLGQGILILLPIFISDILFIYFIITKSASISDFWIIVFFIQLSILLIMIIFTIISMIKIGIFSKKKN
jgi:hypothetical protein